MSEQNSAVTLEGRAISAGLMAGNAFVYRQNMEVPATSYEIGEPQIAQELQRLERATQTVTEDLRVSARRIEADTNANLAAVFEVHEMMLNDPGLRAEIKKVVEEEMISAAQALVRVFRRRERRFREMEQPAQQKLADDVADLSGRLLREMAGIKTTSLEKMPPGRVLVAQRLLPSDTVALQRRSVAGIVVEFGGPGSHAALLAEAMGIPTVGQIANATDQIAEGDELIVDGYRGRVILRPDAGTWERCVEEAAGTRERIAQAMRMAGEAARTRDGTLVKVLANVSCREDVVAAVENGADGIGLYRIEQYYLARKIPPTTAELLEDLQTMFLPMKDKPITVRLLDLGGDKPLPFLKLPPEDNSFLGRRGVRLLLRYPDLLDTQLQALWQFSQDHDVQILVPMVTLADDMAAVRERLQAAAGCGKTLPLLGAMIETPAAALTVADIIHHSDFLSIGTNDLTQYTMAANRENPSVSEYFREDHPAVLRLVRMIATEAGAVPVTICGELARQVDALPALLEMGIRNLSAAPPLVPAIKEAIRSSVV